MKKLWAAFFLFTATPPAFYSNITTQCLPREWLIESSLDSLRQRRQSLEGVINIGYCIVTLALSGIYLKDDSSSSNIIN